MRYFMIITTKFEDFMTICHKWWHILCVGLMRHGDVDLLTLYSMTLYNIRSSTLYGQPEYQIWTSFVISFLL